MRHPVIDRQLAAEADLLRAIAENDPRLPHIRAIAAALDRELAAEARRAVESQAMGAEWTEPCAKCGQPVEMSEERAATIGACHLGCFGYPACSCKAPHLGECESEGVRESGRESDE